MEKVSYYPNVTWFSGTGAGGQHRNKHQNCCRLTLEYGGEVLSSVGQNSKSRRQNLKDALQTLKVKMLDSHKVEKSRVNTTSLRRTYNEVDNRVVDHVTGEKTQYKKYELGKV